jgi:hypothetical protein
MKDIQQVDGETFASIFPADVSNSGAPEQTSVPGGYDGQPAISGQYTIAPVRPEQAAFRRALFERFDGRCAITGCAVAELLDAAHLPSRNWALGHNTADDGILLRTDLHRALDTGLIRVDDHLKLVWADSSVIELYGNLISE